MRAPSYHLHLVAALEVVQLASTLARDIPETNVACKPSAVNPMPTHATQQP